MIRDIETNVVVEQDNYESMEHYTTAAGYALSSTMEKLLKCEDDLPPKPENIDMAIDCAETLVKVLAVFHKGRETEHKRKLLENTITSVDSDLPKIENNE